MNPIHMNPMTSAMAPFANNVSAATKAQEQSSPRELESVGNDFEGVFLSMMIKEMRNSLDGGFFGEESSDTYGGMFDMFIGKHLAESQPLGISNMLLEQYDKTQKRDSTSLDSPPVQMSITG